MLMVVEVLKDAMMCTTFSMVVLGTLFLFPGFFIKTKDLVPIVRVSSYDPLALLVLLLQLMLLLLVVLQLLLLLRVTHDDCL
jgi:hypothetical protein